MAFVSTGGKVVRVSPDNALGDRKEGVSFFRLQSNINASLLERLIVKSNMQ